MTLGFTAAANGGHDGKTKTVIVDDATLVYRTYGDKGGTPLVLLAPLGFSLDDWDPAVINGLARRLARRLRQGDPLARRVKLTRTDALAAMLGGLGAFA